MSKKLFFIIMAMVLVFNVNIVMANTNLDDTSSLSEEQNIGFENLNNNQKQKPTMHYYGYGITDDKDFEIAHALFFEHKGSDTTNRFKKPAGTIQLGKQMLFIVEAKVETEEAKLDSNQQIDQIGQESQEAQVNYTQKMPAISQIRSCTGKISTSYYERPLNPPEPGQTSEEVSSAAISGTANIVGNITLNSVEKEAGSSKKKVICGIMTVNGQTYNLYLDPRVVKPKQNNMQGGPQMPPPPRRGGGRHGEMENNITE